MTEPFMPPICAETMRDLCINPFTPIDRYRSWKILTELTVDITGLYESLARITPTSVYIGGKELTTPISEGGVSVILGGDDDFNRLIIEFIVGGIVVEGDPPIKWRSQ